MRTAEETALDHGLCRCDESYTKRGLTAPDCPYHAFAVEEAMKGYALEAMKADRERVANHAKTTRSCSVWNCEGESVDKESILNLPYELP